ncbi:hypothetical protein JQK87_04600 [Streptomyces sp. G44]|uniref:hypothetical protein n=1 Tax=Streptomyces sp. G44 TaxID=2807632 RepID=UPI001961CA97|nr:hypothetical protein [Streptomyces sp. G44]MBM7167697.1 hypothetical protein [Streptomyces sp. G44]
MDAQEARDDLEQARLAYATSVHPPLPGWAPPACGLLLGAAVAIVGLAPASIWWRLAAIAAAVLLALGARGMMQAIRRKQGVRGVQGPARKAQAALATSALAIVVIALTAPAEIRWLYAAMGVAVAAIVWTNLRKKVRT